MGEGVTSELGALVGTAENVDKRVGSEVGTPVAHVPFVQLRQVNDPLPGWCIPGLQEAHDDALAEGPQMHGWEELHSSSEVSLLK